MHITFGKTEITAGLKSIDCQIECRIVSQSYIFTGEANQPPGYIYRILSPVNHPAEPVHSGIDITVPHGFMKCGNDIVVLFSVFIIVSGFFIQEDINQIFGNTGFMIFYFTVDNQHFQCIEGGSCISVGKNGNLF